jgi:apolipoprotein N-acyltransferase
MAFVAFVAGALAVLGFAPVHAWPVPLAALAVLFFLWTRAGSVRDAAIVGYAFGLAYFLAGVSWVYVSLHFYGAMPAILAGLATLLFCAYLAIWTAATGALAVRLAGNSTALRLLIAPAAYVLMEWLRGTLFTGFPWLTLGTSQVPNGPLSGYAALWGVYGVTLIAGACAALGVAAASRGFARGKRIGAALATLALLAAGLGLRGIEWTHVSGAPIRVALLQGNVAQELKWREEVRERTLADYRRMILEADADVVVIPETALPAFLDQLPPTYLQALRSNGRLTGKDILLGTVERTSRNGEDEYFNSLLRITGNEPQSYRKRHLVPFGEFIPWGFHWVLAILHIPLSDFSHGREQQAPLMAHGVRFGVAICYEDIFGSEMIRFLPDAQALVNVSNMAWFGDSLAPEQHLQESQMRALETGRWMVRSTNTGVTAAIDPHGEVAARMPTFTHGTLVARIEPYAGLTPYARFGNLPSLWAASVVVLLAAFAARRLRRTEPR